MPPGQWWDDNSGLFSKWRSYTGKQDTPPPPPPVSHRTALLAAIAYTLLYIAPFYLSATLRTNGALAARDSPPIIRARVRAVGLTCALCSLITVYLLAVHGHASPWETLRLLGLYPVTLLDVGKVVLLLSILYLGPLFETLLADGSYRSWTPRAFGEAVWSSWTGYRNYLIAPLTEELVFRSLTISLYLLSRTPARTIVLTTPLIFGLAHLHHLIDFLRTHTPHSQRLPPLNLFLTGIVRSAIMFGYTSLFGFFAAFLFLRTGNLYAAVVAHSFCNWQGVPRIWGRVGAPPTEPPSTAAAVQDLAPPPTADIDQMQLKREDGPASASLSADSASKSSARAEGENEHDGLKALGVGWTVAYYVLLVTGAAGFHAMLWPLTESVHALATL